MVVATTTVGTTTSDFIDRTLRLGYVTSSAGLLALLIAVLIIWKLTTGKIAADHIATRTDEVFYWLTILVSNTLGTALGDFSSETLPDLMDKIAHVPPGVIGAAMIILIGLSPRPRCPVTAGHAPPKTWSA